MSSLETPFHLQAVSLWPNPSVPGNISECWAANICAGEELCLAWIHPFTNSAVPKQCLGTFLVFCELNDCSGHSLQAGFLEPLVLEAGRSCSALTQPSQSTWTQTQPQAKFIYWFSYKNQNKLIFPCALCCLRRLFWKQENPTPSLLDKEHLLLCGFVISGIIQN